VIESHLFISIKQVTLGKISRSNLLEISVFTSSSKQVLYLPKNKYIQQHKSKQLQSVIFVRVHRFHSVLLLLTKSCFLSGF